MNGLTKMMMLVALAAIAQPFADALFFQTVHQATPEQSATAAEITAEIMRSRKSEGG
jgi:hypothetical protein